MGTDDGSKSMPKSDFMLWLLRARRWAIAASSTAASSPKLSIWGLGSLAFLLLLLFLLSGDDADLDGQQRSSSGHRQLIAAGFLDDDGHGGGNAPTSEGWCRVQLIISTPIKFDKWYLFKSRHSSLKSPFARTENSRHEMIAAEDSQAEAYVRAKPCCLTASRMNSRSFRSRDRGGF